MPGEVHGAKSACNRTEHPTGRKTQVSKTKSKPLTSMRRPDWDVPKRLGLRVYGVAKLIGQGSPNTDAAQAINSPNSLNRQANEQDKHTGQSRWASRKATAALSQHK